MKKPKMRTFFPDNRLTKLVMRRGGKSREMAVKQAIAEIENHRDEYVRCISELLRELRDLDGGVELSRGRKDKILVSCDRVINVAGSLGFDTLVNVLKSLADLTAHFTENQSDAGKAIIVHMQALALCDPSMPALTDEASTHLLERLARVRERFGCAPARERSDVH